MRTVGYLICAISVCHLAGCDGSAGDGTGGGGNGDITVYEDDVEAVLEHLFSGTIEDGGHEVPCRFAGQPFALDLWLASPMSCQDAEGEPADCTDAATGGWDLEGELSVDAAYHATGTARIFDLETLHAVLSTDLPCYRNSLGDGAMDQLDFGEEIAQLDWAIQDDEQQTDEWEVCLLNVESIE